MSGKIEVLHILNENPTRPTGGLGVHVRDLCNELKNYDDIKSTVMCVDYMYQEGGLYQVNEKIRRVNREDWKEEKNTYRLIKIFNDNEVITRYGYITKNITEHLFIKNALYFLNEDKFDIIHLHDSALWNVADDLRRLYRCKIITTCHLSFYLNHKINPKSPYYMYDYQIESLAFHNSNKVIAVSENYAERIKKHYYLDNVIGIKNGINYNFLKNIKYNEELKKAFENYEKLIVFVGRLVPSKGIDMIIKAIKKLKNYYFILISEIAPTLEDINPLCKPLKKMKNKNFKWLKNCSQDLKWQYMKIADIGIMPSLHEPFGLVALEFMALGTSLIVTQVDGLKEFCTEDNANIIETNTDSLVKKIKYFNRDNDKVKRGIETAKEMTWKKVTDKNIKIYKEILSRKEV